MYLLARNDAWVFINVTGPLGVLFSFLSRTLWKVAVDHTGHPLFRLPGIVGGLYWTWNTVAGIAATYGAIYLFFEEHTEVDAGLKDAVWAVAITLGAVFAIGFCAFLCLIDSNYIATFFSTETTCQWVQSRYLEGTTDEVKYSLIVQRNPHCWKSIRPQVKADMLAKWEGWETNKPAWFDELFVANVDDDMMPPQALRRLKMTGGGERRRSSVGERISVRLSAKERVGVAATTDEGATGVEEGAGSVLA
jgi:hypothetical protein